MPFLSCHFVFFARITFVSRRHFRSCGGKQSAARLSESALTAWRGEARAVSFNHVARRSECFHSTAGTGKRGRFHSTAQRGGTRVFHSTARCGRVSLFRRRYISSPVLQTFPRTFRRATSAADAYPSPRGDRRQRRRCGRNSVW